MNWIGEGAIDDGVFVGCLFVGSRLISNVPITDNRYDDASKVQLERGWITFVVVAVVLFLLQHVSNLARGCGLFAV